MATQPPHGHSRSSARQSRRVVLDTVVRRDAAQRLSLALTLLARAACEDGASTGVASAQPSDTSPTTADLTLVQEEQPA